MNPSTPSRETAGMAPSPVNIFTDLLDTPDDHHVQPKTANVKFEEDEKWTEILYEPLSPLSLPSMNHIVNGSGMVHGVVVRDGMKITLSYQLKGGKETAVLVAEKQSKLNSKYHIFDVSKDGNADRQLTKKDPHYLGKFRHNKDRSVMSYSLIHVHAEETQLAEYLFETPAFKDIIKERLTPPRSLQVAIYSEPTDDSSFAGGYGNNNLLSASVSDSIAATGELQGVAAVHLGLHLLHTKEPFHKETGRLALDFKGRGREASTKNMQLEDRSGHVVAQLVKWEKDRFHIDFKEPLNAFQALGFALAQFERKN